MRVKCIINKEKTHRLTLNKNYTVYEAKCSTGDQPTQYNLYRIEDDYGSVIPYESRNFEILSEVNDNYNKKILDNNEVILIHSFIDIKYFWARFYDDDPEMIELFIKAKKDIYSNEMTNKEIFEIIDQDNSDERDFLIDMLIDNKDDNYIEKIITICKEKLSKWENSESLESLFKYLCTFKNDKVNDFFIEYLSENEKGNDVLDKIVYKYFN
ncbi:MAG: hypothetical protein Q4F95_04055 [Oscillospiraceae bacterium]|nr:hypothetical protein [Oscillospiraceae bacterium]